MVIRVVEFSSNRYKIEKINMPKEILNFENWCNVEVSKIGHHLKGQLTSKAIYGLLTSPKKQMDESVLFFTVHGKQIKFVLSFFGRIYRTPICFPVLSDL